MSALSPERVAAVREWNQATPSMSFSEADRQRSETILALLDEREALLAIDAGSEMHKAVRTLCRMSAVCDPPWRIEYLDSCTQMGPGCPWCERAVEHIRAALRGAK